MARKSFEVRDPAKRFAGWAFEVIPAHWETLGVTSTWLIDASRTRALRERLMAEGVPRKDAMGRSIQRFAHVDRVARARHFEGMVSKTTGEPFKMPPQRGYAFAEGYVFRSGDGEGAVQVLDVVDETLDVCDRDPVTGRLRQPYRLSVEELVEWLRSGRAPEDRQISLYELRSELMRTEIRRDNDAA